MKKSILLLLFLIYKITLSAQTENMPAGVQLTPVNPVTEAPPIVIDRFNTKHPDVTESWRKEGDNFAATYIDPNTNMAHIIVYDQNGNIVHSDKQLAEKSYPKNITTFYNSTYPGEKFEIWLREDKNNTKSYYSVRKSDTLHFDKSGKNIPKESMKTAE